MKDILLDDVYFPYLGQRTFLNAKLSGQSQDYAEHGFNDFWR